MDLGWIAPIVVCVLLHLMVHRNHNGHGNRRYGAVTIRAGSRKKRFIQ
jgi:hypothetical protein